MATIIRNSNNNNNNNNIITSIHLDGDNIVEETRRWDETFGWYTPEEWSNEFER